MSNDLVRSAQKQIVHSKSMSGAAGKSLVVAGGTGLGLWFLAGLIPFVSLPMLLVVMVVGGFFLWE
jgi:hypothetical protein